MAKNAHVLRLLGNVRRWARKPAPLKRTRLTVEPLESRVLLTTFLFSTGNPDGKMAAATRPNSAGKFEIETADDFALTTETRIDHATFTGLQPATATTTQVVVEIYRVFPMDSDINRIPQVPTRVN